MPTVDGGMTAHVNSYYAATLSGSSRRAEPDTHMSADVCVVGGGLAGLSTALDLAQGGLSVVLLEAKRIGWGASGRNGGFVSCGYAEGLDTLVRKLGLSAARQLHDLSRDGVAIVEQNIDTFGLDAAQRTRGCLRVVRHDDEDGLKTERDRLERDFDYRVAYWPREKVRNHLKSTTYFQALYDASAIHIHPLNYAMGLADACQRAGVAVFEECPAVSVRGKGAGHSVVTSRGVVDVQHVVLCHSAYGHGLDTALDRAVLPVATYVVATRANAELIGQAIATPAGIADSRRAGDYYRLLPDGRLLWGGRITTQRSEPSRLAALLKQDIIAIYPQLAAIEIEYAWSGLMAYAVHKMPIIDCLRTGMWAASGFGGHGLNTTAIAGRLIASAIADGDDRYRLFAPFGRPWAGGPLGRAATQATYWFYQLRDRIDEQRAQRQTHRTER